MSGGVVDRYSGSSNDEGNDEGDGLIVIVLLSKETDAGLLAWYVDRNPVGRLQYSD